MVLLILNCCLIYHIYDGPWKFGIFMNLMVLDKIRVRKCLFNNYLVHIFKKNKLGVSVKTH